MALASLTYTRQMGLNASGASASTGVAGASFNVNQVQQFSLGKSATNTQPGGADEIYSTVLQIAASGNATINLKSFTDALGVAGIAAARVKAWSIRLLGASQQSPDGSITGNACSQITVGNAGSAPFPFNMSSATTTFTVPNSSEDAYNDGSANGIAVSAGTENVLITNNDGANQANVLVIFVVGTT
jgi:hypothetical protein